MSVFRGLRLQLAGALLASKQTVDPEVGAGQFLLAALATIRAGCGFIFRSAELRGAGHGGLR
jgi:hypothetical protein